MATATLRHLLGPCVDASTYCIVLRGERVELEVRSCLPSSYIEVVAHGLGIGVSWNCWRISVGMSAALNIAICSM